MKAELDDVLDFLNTCEPFAHLPEDTLRELPAAMDMHYVRRGETIIATGDTNDQLYLIRSGAVDVLGPEDILLDRRDAGRSFGYSTLVGDGVDQPCGYTMIAVEDSLLITLPKKEFQRIATENPDVERFYSTQSRRISAAVDQLRENFSGEILRTKISEVMVEDPICISAEHSIQEAAQLMHNKRVSSLLITENNTLKGILTDRDLRSRVLAVGIDPQSALSVFMTEAPLTITPDTLAFEAMMLMAEYSIHHLPVVNAQGSIQGIVSTPDIMRLLRHDPIYLTADLSRRSTPEELRDSHQRAGQVAMRFIDRGASSAETSAILSTAADALCRRLLVLAEEELGAPPVPYTFVVLGSHGRREMGFASDQDNALVLSNKYREEHADYFAALSEKVCRGLDQAGLILCPGDMMAMNPQWRMTASQWEDTFHQWVRAPEPDALLHAQTFFDFRPIHGEAELATAVHAHAVDMAVSARRMHAHLAALAATREPPLGFFRGLVVERSGEYVNTLDIKKGGTAAIVQMARLFALTEGVELLGTRERLEAVAGSKAVSQRGATDLIDAFDYLQTMSFRHQSRQLHAGETPDYRIDPSTLPRMEREHLRDSFHIIKAMQSALATKYPVGTIA